MLATEDENYSVNFLPRALDNELQGQIISVFDGVSQVGQYQIVVLNRGTRDGLERGHVLSINRSGKTVKDSVLAGDFEEDYFNTKKGVDRKATVTLPDEFAGVALVFKIFEKVSYAIVMKAKLAIHVDDKVSSNLAEAKTLRAKRIINTDGGEKPVSISVQ